MALADCPWLPMGGRSAQARAPDGPPVAPRLPPAWDCLSSTPELESMLGSLAVARVALRAGTAAAREREGVRGPAGSAAPRAFARLVGPAPSILVPLPRRCAFGGPLVRALGAALAHVRSLSFEAFHRDVERAPEWSLQRAAKVWPLSRQGAMPAAVAPGGPPGRAAAEARLWPRPARAASRACRAPPAEGAEGAACQPPQGSRSTTPSSRGAAWASAVCNTFISVQCGERPRERLARARGAHSCPPGCSPAGGRGPAAAGPPEAPPPPEAEAVPRTPSPPPPALPRRVASTPAGLHEAGEVPAGAAPSRGAALHFEGRCRPCAFSAQGSCKSGSSCGYCHLCEAGEKKRRCREWKERKKTMEAVALPKDAPGPASPQRPEVPASPASRPPRARGSSGCATPVRRSGGRTPGAASGEGTPAAARWADLGDGR
ncbi:unnamed protein product [Prorocentrum cordatum]|uniref:C3H1-type domain-containing protein n=1 Tax=Prorocentrum cordatum TaxID=2364126 RepID=A0ABN9R8L8_9DINO|nr:unnamed protein product [Polarella glacialis]